MVDTANFCDRCKAPLIEIDHYGERLRGCLDCNRWIWRGSADGVAAGRSRGVKGIGSANQNAKAPPAPLTV